MADQQMELALILKTIDEATKPLREVQKQISELNNAGKRMRGWDDFKRSLSGVQSSFSAMVREASRLGLIVGGIGGGALWLFKRQFIDVAAEAEKYKITLESLEGSTDKAKAAFGWITTFAKDTPLQFNGVMQAFIRLRAFGINPMDGTLQKLVDANAKLNGDQESLMGIILGVGQAWTKTKLQGQEILQLIERGIPVWDLLSKATRKSIPDLQKMSERGEITRDKMRLLFNEIGKWSAGSASKQMGTWSGIVSNLGDHLWRFKVNVMESSGAFTMLKEQVGGILSRLDLMERNGELKALAETVGTKLVSAMKEAFRIGQTLWSAFKVAYTVTSTVVDALGGLRNVLVLIGVAVSAKLIKSIYDFGASLVILGRDTYAIGMPNLLRFVSFARDMLPHSMFELRQMIGLQKVLDAVAYRGGFLKALQFELFTTRLRLLGTVSAMRAWTLGGFISSIRTAAIAMRAFSLSLLAASWPALVVATAAILVIKYWKPIANFFKGVASGFRDGFAPLVPMFRRVASALGPVVSPLKAIWGWFKSLLVPVEATARSFNAGAAAGRALASVIVSVVSNTAMFVKAGANIVTSIYKGIKDNAIKPISALKEMVSKMRDLLPFSPAKAGPFRDLHKIKIVETIVSAIKPAPGITAMKNLATQMTLQGPSHAARIAPARGGAVTVHYAPVISVGEGSAASKQTIESMLRQHADDLLRRIEQTTARRARLVYN